MAVTTMAWPPTFPRAKSRDRGAFKTSLTGALSNVEKSLSAFARDSGKKLENMVLSSNVTLGKARPSDPGVAVWFVWDGMSVCVAVDRYLTVEANLQAIHHIIEARRVELRHGTLALVRATFAGFLALPAPKDHQEWWDVLECKQDASQEVIKANYRRLSSDHHPDRGGDHNKMAAINSAYKKAMQSCQ